MTLHNGRKGLTVYVTPEMQKQLKQLAVNLETTQTALIQEALEDLFEKKNPKIKLG